ncbi:hypothetical protein [Dokdonia sp. Hel_I_53]|uniref:hypothetical protein n=1 Tax=Dokdonia sp. Hel_I_53 TaxID=1566287 RepID=UPI0011998529|nr:hypothetical protein [Dokdonia sp. Hel_I_53]TVZ50894.1 hypothetical protein OD90_0025 [Dokdonia sp. Hel_I_53]
MKNIITTFFTCLIPLIAFAGLSNPNGKYTKEKKIKKEYSVNSDAKLLIKNSYGEVNMVSWSENRIVIEVHVKTNGNDEDRVKDKLDEIDVQFEASASFVSAKTTFDNNSSRSWWNSWKSSNVNMEINYTIKLPVFAVIDISNDYGGITLDRIEGNAKISCDYGKITIGELLADNNYLNFDYTKNSTIGYMKSGRINADYSTFVLENGGNVDLNADYSKSEFGIIKDLNYNCDYGSVRTKESNNITGRGDYLSAKLGTVNGHLNINADYGSIRIDEMSPSAGDIVIQSDYTGINIGYDSAYSFTFNIKLEYAGLSGKDNLNIRKERKDSGDAYYEGYYKSSSSQNNININSDYGGVTLHKN